MTKRLTNEEITEIYQCYRYVIVRRALRFFRDQTVADDILMEVLVRLLERGSAFRELEGPNQKRKWLLVATYHVCVDWYHRTQRPQPDVEEQSWLMPQLKPASPERRDLLRKLQQELDSEDRTLAILVFEEQYTKMETHQQTGRSRPFVDRRLAHISQRLRALDASCCP